MPLGPSQGHWGGPFYFLTLRQQRTKYESAALATSTVYLIELVSKLLSAAIGCEVRGSAAVGPVHIRGVVGVTPGGGPRGIRPLGFNEYGPPFSLIHSTLTTIIISLHLGSWNRRDALHINACGPNPNTSNWDLG